MKKCLKILVLILIITGSYNLYAGTGKVSFIDSLLTLDPEISQYFPRWKLCEPNLQIQIYHSFVVAGFNKDSLNKQKIEVLSAPLKKGETTSDILLITCGEASMRSVEIDLYMRQLAKVIKGDKDGAKDYCFQMISREQPITDDQAKAIINYLEPTDVNNAIVLSLFQQSLKIAKSGFWIISSMGTDPIGYHFWSSGESKIVLKRPLYVNHNYRTSERIPYLIDAYIGGGYRNVSGVDTKGSVLNWVSQRMLNVSSGGKFVGGLDFHLPSKPEFGIHVNVELPLRALDNKEAINTNDFYFNMDYRDVEFNPNDIRYNSKDYIKIGIAPVLRSTGQVSLFYNWWMNENNPENYFKFDVGISYSEIQEMLVYRDNIVQGGITYMDVNGIDNLYTYKPNELGDWIYLKAEYRSQATYPFSLSLQYSNQILLGRAYMPILGSWLFLEGKFSTPLRGLRPFEHKNFFMFSPVLRFTI